MEEITKEEIYGKPVCKDWFITVEKVADRNTGERGYKIVDFRVPSIEWRELFGDYETDYPRVYASRSNDSDRERSECLNIYIGAYNGFILRRGYFVRTCELDKYCTYIRDAKARYDECLKKFVDNIRDWEGVVTYHF